MVPAAPSGRICPHPFDQIAGADVSLTFPAAAVSYYSTSQGGLMNTHLPESEFARPAPAPRLERAAAALAAHGFGAEILADAAAARSRIKELIPAGASVFTGASETLRLSGIEADINDSGRYDAIRSRGRAMDRATQMDEIRRVLASP